MSRLGFGIALGLAGLAPALGLTAEETFYPPTLNDTAYIGNSSIGTYGGIYQADTTGPTGGSPYGTYDYCSMPHPRTQEYELPEALSKGKVQGKLVYLEYLQRHQRRSPYNILPGGEVRYFSYLSLWGKAMTDWHRMKHMTATMSDLTSMLVPARPPASSQSPCMRRHTRTPPTHSHPA